MQPNTKRKNLRLNNKRGIVCEPSQIIKAFIRGGVNRMSRWVPAKIDCGGQTVAKK
jgi:hypothetical protein